MPLPKNKCKYCNQPIKKVTKTTTHGKENDLTSYNGIVNIGDWIHISRKTGNWFSCSYYLKNMDEFATPEERTSFMIHGDTNVKPKNPLGSTSRVSKRAKLA